CRLRRDLRGHAGGGTGSRTVFRPQETRRGGVSVRMRIRLALGRLQYKPDQCYGGSVKPACFLTDRLNCGRCAAFSSITETFACQFDINTALLHCSGNLRTREDLNKSVPETRKKFRTVGIRAIAGLLGRPAAVNGTLSSNVENCLPNAPRGNTVMLL